MPNPGKPIRKTRPRNPRTTEWREFEKLVASIEERLAPIGAVINSPDRIRDLDTSRLREVDASIRLSVGSAEVLITIECRKRKGVADVMWIEQLATKRAKVGAAKTIAVSAAGFTKDAQICANRYGIELRVLSEISPDVITGWITPEPLTHAYNIVENIICEVMLPSGQVIAVDEMENCFRHPAVHGDFPPSAFVSFLEMKDPTLLWNPGVFEAREYAFELDGNDPDLIPVPLGVQRKPGNLEVRVGEQYVRVSSLRLRMTAVSRIETVSVGDGAHFAYGPPDSPTSAMSRFKGEIAGVPVRIERVSRPGEPPSAIAAFGNGLELPSRLIDTQITDMASVDTERLHLQPVRIKFRHGLIEDGKVKFEPGSLINGVLFRPSTESFDSPEQRIEFDSKYFMFFLPEDMIELYNIGLDLKAANKLFRERVSIFPREAVDFIDIGPMIAALGANKDT